MSSSRPDMRPLPPRRGGRWAVFVRRHGWRAYAVPVLGVITIAALVHDAAAGAPVHQSPATASSTRVQVEGLNKGSAKFVAGVTPKPELVATTDDGQSCAANSYPQLVLVSISRQHMWVCDGHRQIDSSPVTTGRSVDNDQTPLGSWRVQAKQRDRYLVGPGYRDYVHFWMPFNGDFGLHDAPWQTMAYGSKDYTVNGSHGCVHVPHDTMARLYAWAHTGSTVVTIES